MKNIILLLISLISFVGWSEEKEYEVNQFFNLNIIGNFKVTLISSNQHKVRVINNDEDILLESIIVENKGNELILKLKKDTYKKREIEFIVYYKELFNIKAKRGAYVVFKENLKSKSLNVEVNSGAHIILAIDSKSANFTIKNGGKIEAKGKIESVNFYISKGGSLDAYQLISTSVNAEVLFGGEMFIYVTNSLNAVVKSGGTIKYKGKPSNVTEDIKIGGKIVKIDK